jgi:hypothetical protein
VAPATSWLAMLIQCPGVPGVPLPSAQKRATAFCSSVSVRLAFTTACACA